MRRPTFLVATSLLTIAACSDSPAGPMVISTPPSVSTDLTPGTNPPCTHSWASAVNGNWDDASKWTPASVPGSSASVCITAAGTYSVVLARAAAAPAAAIDALTLGGSGGVASLDLGQPGSTGPGKLDVAQGVSILSAGRLRLGAGMLISGGVITVDGTLTTISPCCVHTQVIRGDILNRGIIDIRQPLLLDKVDATYENHGTWNVGTNLLSAQLTIPASAGHSTFAMKAGSITGGGLAGVRDARDHVYLHGWCSWGADRGTAGRSHHRRQPVDRDPAAWARTL